VGKVRFSKPGIDILYGMKIRGSNGFSMGRFQHKSERTFRVSSGISTSVQAMRVKVFTSTIRGTETIFLAEDKPIKGNIKKNA
jgi:hypothetical protein